MHRLTMLPSCLYANSGASFHSAALSSSPASEAFICLARYLPCCSATCARVGSGLALFEAQSPKEKTFWRVLPEASWHRRWPSMLKEGRKDERKEVVACVWGDVRRSVEEWGGVGGRWCVRVCVCA